MSLYYSLKDLDLFAPNIDYNVKGKQSAPSILGSVLSLSVVGAFLLFFIQYCIFSSQDRVIEIKTKTTNCYGMYHYDYIYDSLESTQNAVKTQQSHDNQQVLLTSNPKTIQSEYLMHSIFKNNLTLSNADLLTLGFLLVDKTKNTVISLNEHENQILKMSVKSTQITVISNQTIENNITRMNDSTFSNCKNIYEKNRLQVNGTNSNFNFEYVTTTFPFISNYQCLDNLSVRLSKSALLFYPESNGNYSITSLSFFLEPTCTKNSNNINCVEQSDAMTMNLMILTRNFKMGKELIYIPNQVSVDLKQGTKKILKLYYKSRYFYRVPLNIMMAFSIVPFYSTLDLFQSSIIAEDDPMNSTLLDIQIIITDEVEQIFFLNQNLLFDIGILGNLLFFFFFLGKILFYLLSVDSDFDWILNEIMIIIDPKYNSAIELMEKEIEQDLKEKNNNLVIVKKNDYLKYNDLQNEGQDLKTKKSKHKIGEKSTFFNPPRKRRANKFLDNQSKEKADIEKALRENNINGDELDQGNFWNEKIKKEEKKQKLLQLKKTEVKLKMIENIIFSQINRFNINEKTSFQVRSLIGKHFKEKREMLRKAKKILFESTDISNIVLSINTMKCLLYKILLSEYQYFLLNHLSNPTIMGSYLIGYSSEAEKLSRFSDKIEYQEMVHNFKKAWKTFRKNGKFLPYDKKMLNLCKLFVQDNLIESFIQNLGKFYEKTEKYKEKYHEENFLDNFNY